jgi:hypothetical protein
MPRPEAADALPGRSALGAPALRHLRPDELENCHPRRRLSNWITRNLVVAGNFNMTNVDELFDLLVNIGQHPKERSPTP